MIYYILSHLVCACTQAPRGAGTFPGPSFPGFVAQRAGCHIHCSSKHAKERDHRVVYRVTIIVPFVTFFTCHCLVTDDIRVGTVPCHRFGTAVQQQHQLVLCTTFCHSRYPAGCNLIVSRHEVGFHTGYPPFFETGKHRFINKQEIEIAPHHNFNVLAPGICTQLFDVLFPPAGITGHPFKSHFCCKVDIILIEFERMRTSVAERTIDKA